MVTTPVFPWYLPVDRPVLVSAGVSRDESGAAQRAADASDPLWLSPEGGE